MRQSEIRFGETACVIGLLGLIGQILVRLLRGAGVVVVEARPARGSLSSGRGCGGRHLRHRIR